MKKMQRIHEAEVMETREHANSVATAFVRGLFVGGVLGAGAMFLFAPKSGKRSRAKIQHQYDEFRDQIRESLEEAEEEVLENARHAAVGAHGKVKELQHH